MKSKFFAPFMLLVLISSCEREYTIENDPKDLSDAVLYMNDFYTLYANSKSDSIWVKYNPNFSKDDFLEGIKSIESRIGRIQQVKSKMVKTTRVSNSNGLKKDYVISLEGKYESGSTEELLTIQTIEGKTRIIGYSVEKILEGN